MLDLQASYLERTTAANSPLEFDVTARFDPNVNDWVTNTYQIKYIITMECDADSSRVVTPTSPLPQNIQDNISINYHTSLG